MGLGVLSDRHLKHVPGTVHVLETEQQTAQALGRAPKPGVKYDFSGPTPIVLVPQPSDDPNDPLNWPLWKKDVIIIILSIASVLAVSLSSILAANSVTLSFYFRRTFADVALLTGWHLCGVGVAGALFVASARIWGKRHLYLLGVVLLLASSIWAGASRSYKSFLWARVIQGVAVAPFEALVNASVGDLYYVHQRGIRMAISSVALFGSAFFTPILVGRITVVAGWPWTFYVLAIFAGAILPFVVFFTPETTYTRAARLNTDIAMADYSHTAAADFVVGGAGMGGAAGSAAAAEDTGAKSGPSAAHDRDFSRDDMAQKEVAIGEPPRIDRSADDSLLPKRVSFARQLLPFNGRHSDENFFKLLLRPFPLFLHPAIFWACLIQGALIGWSVLIGVVLAAIFLGPPLFFDEEKAGYLYTGAFIGAMLGFAVSGLLADWSARVLTRRNGGVYEPEFRIVLVIPQMVFGCAGLYGFGITSANVAKYGWFWPDFFFALEVMGMVIGTVSAGLYIIDAHRDISVEAFTALLIFKNMFSFALTWSAFDWLLQYGQLRTFRILGSVQVGICLLSIPMYIFGKRNRSFFYRHDILKLLKLR